MLKRFQRLDAEITHWMARHGIQLLRASLGLVFLWFGALKFFPSVSPAEGLASKTFAVLTFDWIGGETAVHLLAAWECLIGIGLLTGLFLRVVLLLLWMQMLGTLSPLLLFPEETFTRFPWAPTLEGQYIIKNVVLISAAVVIGATVRGGGVVADATHERTKE